VQDVRITELVLDRLRPWVSGVNWGLFTGHDSRVCPNCGNVELDRLDGTKTAVTGRYVTWRCRKCGTVARDAQRSVSVPMRGA
jgi:predicted RNA-binding Zn-ribbon protein involved in translation (DUF1610 family)